MGRICNVTVQIHAVMRTLKAQLVADTEPFALMHASHCECYQGAGFMNVLQARGFTERSPAQDKSAVPDGSGESQGIRLLWNKKGTQ